MVEVSHVVLASASPRRKQLLALLGLFCEARAADIDESPMPNESAGGMALRLGAAKAAKVAAERCHAVVVAADTLVVLDGAILGKPADSAAARRMLESLRNRQHLVHTGLAVIDGTSGRGLVWLVVTPVTMRNYGDEELNRYVASGDPLDKAGAYAIQYQDFRPVAGFDGCYTNVMGLPLCHLYRILYDWGLVVPVHPLECCPYHLENGCSWAEPILSGPSCGALPLCAT